MTFGTEALCRRFRSMPRYFFHVHDVAPRTDEQGEALPDDEAAWREATSFAAALFGDVDGKFRPAKSGA